MAKKSKTPDAGEDKLDLKALAKEFEVTPKMAMFTLCYASNGFNGRRAAEDAGYRGSKKTLAVIATENLTKPSIRKLLSHLLASRVMSLEEAMARLSDQARGFDPASYITQTERFMRGKDGNVYPAGVDYALDLEALERDGYSHLIKGIRNTPAGPVFEFYDQQAALALLGRHHGAFLDRSQVDAKLLVADTPYTDDELIELASAVIRQRADRAASDS